MTTLNNWGTLNPDIKPLDGWEELSDDINGRHSYLIEYYKSCRRGECIIGRELMSELETLVQDIFNADTPYRFDLEAPHKRIRFIETEVKHFESPFAGKPFILTLPQKAITEAVFGFTVFDGDLLGGGRWVRRFKEVMLLIGRKNGKTPFVAALVLAEWVCGEAGQKVMCASNDYEQAGIVFDCINNFREESRALSKVTRKNVKGIFFGNMRQRRKTGKFSAQNKGTIKKMSARTGAKEGRNLKMVIVDEVHEMKDGTTIMPLRSSLTTQDEPLFFEITTEGMVRDGYLDERLNEARKVLRGEEHQPRWLIWLYTQDSEAEIWNDETSWQKSNPHLGTVKKISELRDLVEKARSSSAQRTFTLAKEFNIKQNRAQAWLEEKVIQTDGRFELEDFRGSRCIIGVDLAETNDLCACTYLLMKPNDPTLYFHTMYFVTSVKAADGQATESPTNPERKDYKTWEADGLCKIVQGSIIDDGAIVDYIVDVYKKFGIRPFKVGYDNWHSAEFARLMKVKFDPTGAIMVRVRMNFETLNVPTRQLEAELNARHVNYNKNEICRWCLRNTALRYNNIGWVMPTKVDGYIGNKMDGTMTKIITLAVLREYKTEFVKVIGG